VATCKDATVIRISLKRARDDLLALVRAVEADGERIVLTRRGRPVAALLPAGAIEALDLLGRLFPHAADVAAGLRPVDALALLGTQGAGGEEHGRAG
jgi:prevent-host-death family protein